MRSNVLINIHTTTVSVDGVPDTMELISPATIERLWDGALEITYEESEITGMEGTTTHIFLTETGATMLREGNISTQLDFQEGQEHVSMYETPFGSMLLRIRTVKLKSTITLEEGGVLDLYYTMEIDNQLYGHYLLHLTVQKPDHPAEDGQEQAEDTDETEPSSS